MNHFKRWGKSWRRLFHLVLAALILGTGVGRVHAEAPEPYLVKDINSGHLDSSPTWLINLDGTLFFRAYDRVHGTGLWKSNGTESSTTRLSDIEPGYNCYGGSRLVNINGTLFFSVSDDVYGEELWKSDGTQTGTVLVRDIYPEKTSISLCWMTNMQGMLFFTVYVGDKLWKSDGTEAGTVAVKYIKRLQNLTGVNDTLFFIAWNPGPDDNGYALYKSDGTVAGTVIVKDIYPGCLFCEDDEMESLYGLTNVGDTLFFRGTDGVHGWELWTSDGTLEGTAMVRDIMPGSGGSVSYYLLTNVNGTFFFGARDDVHGRELYKSNDAGTGTVLVKDINPGSGDSDPAYSVNVGGVLYFSADDGVHGRELYKSDGTEAGTVRVGDIYPGAESSDPLQLANVGGVLFFSADDGVHGRELWMSDGTEAGTVRVGDIYPGVGSSDPERLANVGGVLYFTADDGVHARELWALSIRLDLALTQTVTPTTPVLPGAPLTYTLAFNNASLTAASGIVITDHLPLALTQVGVTSSGATITRTPGITFTWQVEDLAPGEGGVITITGVVDPEFPDGVFTNTATITSTSEEAYTGNNSSSADVTVHTPALRVFKSVQGPGGATANLLPGDVVTYTITLENSLDEVAAGVLMTDLLPAEVSFGAWLDQGSAQLPPPSGTGTLAREFITWGPYSIPPDEAVSMAFTASVALGTALAGARVANTAWFSSADAGSGFDSAVFTIKFTDLFLPLVTKKQL